MKWLIRYQDKWGDHPAAILVLDSEVHGIFASQMRMSYMVPKASFSDMQWMLMTHDGKNQVPVRLHREVFPDQYPPNSAVCALAREHRLLPGKNETEALVSRAILEE